MGRPASVWPTHFICQRRSIRSGSPPIRVDQIVLDVILLEVDEGRHFCALLGQQIKKLLDVPFSPLKQAADFPGDAFCQHRSPNAPTVEKFPRCVWPSKWHATLPIHLSPCAKMTLGIAAVGPGQWPWQAQLALQRTNGPAFVTLFGLLSGLWGHIGLVLVAVGHYP